MPFFFFHDPPPTQIYTLSLHDALPILPLIKERILVIILLLHFLSLMLGSVLGKSVDRKSGSAGMPRPISYAVFCLKKKTADLQTAVRASDRHRAEQVRDQLARALPQGQ